jgi:hypothetical protein
MRDKKRVEWFLLAAWGFIALFIAMSWYGTIIGDVNISLASGQTLTMTVPYVWQGGVISWGTGSIVFNAPASFGTGQAFDSTCTSGQVTFAAGSNPLILKACFTLKGSAHER